MPILVFVSLKYFHKFEMEVQFLEGRWLKALG